MVIVAIAFAGLTFVSIREHENRRQEHEWIRQEIAKCRD